MSISTPSSRHINSNTTEWLSPTEICEQLHIPLQTFYQWRAPTCQGWVRPAPHSNFV